MIPGIRHRALEIYYYYYIIRSSLALLSVVGAIGRAGPRKKVGWLRPGRATWPEGASAPNGAMMCREHGVPEMAMRIAHRQ